MDKKRRILKFLPIALAVALGVGILTYFLWKGDNTATAEILTAPAARRDLNSGLLVAGRITPQAGAEAEIYAKVTGTVKEVFVSPGDMVALGQKLIALDSNDLETLEIQVARAKSDLAQAEAKYAEISAGAKPEEITMAENNVKQAEINLEAAKINYERQKQLLDESKENLITARDYYEDLIQRFEEEEEGITEEDLAGAEKELTKAEEAYDGCVLQLEKAEKELKLEELKYSNARQQLSLLENKYSDQDIAATKVQVEQTRANLKDAEQRLAFADFTSPIAGVITARGVNPGNTVGKEGAAPLLTILDLGRLQVEAYVDEVEISKIATGQKAVVFIDAYPEDEFMGIVAAVSPLPFEDGNAVYFTVTIFMTNPDERLRPGLTVDTEIYLEQQENVIAVPSEAVRRVDGKQAVYVLIAGRYELRPVTTGWRDARYTEITSGLQEGEEVVVKGFDQMGTGEV